MAIKLSLPKVAAVPDPGIELRPRHVEKAVASFTYTNPSELLTQSMEALHKLNAQPLKVELRIALLDLYLQPYAFGLNVRRTQDPAKTMTSLNRQRAISRRLRINAIELALGYKQALSELIARATQPSASKEYLTCLQRALLFTSQAVLHCYDEYRPTEARLWLEIIALFRAAERQKLAQQAVPAPIDDPIFAQSIAACFKRFCLTSLVDPYHLAYGELWIVHEAFGEYADAALIGDMTDLKRPAGLFVIDPAVDAKPTALAQYKTVPASHCRLLDANPVLAPLSKRYQGERQGEVLASHVLAAMIRALGLPPKRHTPRGQSQGTVDVAASLSTVHYFISEDCADPQEGHSNDEDIEIGSAATRPERRNAAYRHESWSVSNEGPGGMGILRNTQPQSPVGVGDLIGIKIRSRSADERQWHIGVVRWLSIDGEQDYQIGVQTLGKSAMPVGVYSENVTDTITRIPRPALALPAMGHEPGNTLVTPRGLFARGDHLRVETDGQSWLVEALALAESTATFDRFTYRIIYGA